MRGRCWSLDEVLERQSTIRSKSSRYCTLHPGFPRSTRWGSSTPAPFLLLRVCSPEGFDSHTESHLQKFPRPVSEEGRRGLPHHSIRSQEHPPPLFSWLSSLR